MELTAKLSLEEIQDSKNLCARLGEEDLKNIGNDVIQAYDVDKQSRRRWEKNMEEATKLAVQLKEPKSYPWRNASNVKFPLLTIASLQFQSRAYPSLVKAPDLVKYRVQGKDDGTKAARAQRISAHMSYQLLEQDESWEEDQDKAFLVLPILGCVFKKSYYDSVAEHNRSRLVLPKNLVVHYYAKSIEDCERKTEIFELYERQIRERELRGIFVENDYGPPAVGDFKEEDERQGLTPPLDDWDAPREFLEQHRYLDLDGDGYREPYVVTVDKESKQVARIVHRIESVVTEQSVKIEELNKRITAIDEGRQGQEQELAANMQAGFDPTQEQLAQITQAEQTSAALQAQIREIATQTPVILKINAVEHYTKYSFIPSPDGGFYDLGFGQLLGDVGHAVNTGINQLMDSGSLQNTNCGWIARGARVKGGKQRFQFGEWKRVDVAGGTLRDSIVPLPVNQPSDVVFSLLSLLINYAERIGSVTDTMMGENPGQNTPAYNMSAMLEQGMQLFNGIFKRVYRSQRAEFRKLYKLNAIYLDQQEYFEYQDSDEYILKTDYTADSKDLIPAADPNAFSNKEKAMKAQIVSDRAGTVPGYNTIKAEQGLLEALDVPNAREVYPTQMNPETGAEELVFPPQPDPELEIEKADMQRRTLEGQSRAEKDMVLAQSKINVDEAQIIKLIADASVAADSPELERLKLLLKEQESLRKSLVEMAKIESADEQSKRAANSGVGGKSSND